VNRHTGTGWGWILMNRDLEFHILETGFQWVDYEADVAVQSGSEIVIDAWEEPVPDDTSD
jgi:superoxide dismutase